MPKSKLTSIVHGILLVGSLLLIHTGTLAQSSPAEIKSLTSSAVEYKIGAQPDRFVIRLKQDAFAQVRVSQKRADVVLRLLDKSDNELARMNFLNRDDVVETLSFIAPRSGAYTLEISVFDPKAAKAPDGSYSIHLAASRKPTPLDRRRVEVERLFVEAMTQRARRDRLSESIDKFKQALAGWQELGDGYMAQLTSWKITQSRAVDLFVKAEAIAQQEKVQDYAIGGEYFETAAALFHEVGDFESEFHAIGKAADLAQRLVQVERAIELIERLLPSLSRLSPNAQNMLLGDLAKMYASSAATRLQSGNTYGAIERFLQALKINSDETTQATNENDIGAIYYVVGEFDDALKYLELALKRREKLPDKCALSATLANLGAVFSAKDKKTLALTHLNRALDEGGTCPKERPYALINLGKVYNEIGAPGLALESLCEAVKLPMTIITPALAAPAHNNLGIAYYALAEYGDALASYQTALAHFRTLGDQKNEATVLSNIGVVYSVQGRNDEALAEFRKSLEKRSGLGDLRGEAVTLNNIGEVLAVKGQTREARAAFDQALPLFKAAADKNGEAVTLSNEMAVWNSLGNRPMAIFFGKQAINGFQELRGAARGLDNEIQKDYLRTVRRSYQQLAELLIAEGLDEQAVEILNLYQDETFFDFDIAPDKRVQQAEPSLREGELGARYEAAGVSLKELGSRIREMRRQLSFRPPKPEETNELEKLEGQFKAAVEIFSTVLRNGEQELVKPGAGDKQGRSVKTVGEFKDTLGELGRRKHRAVALYTLTGADRLYVLLVKPDGVEAYSHNISREALSGRVNALFPVLTDRTKEGAELFTPLGEAYDLLFKSTSTRDRTKTLAADLAAYKPQTLLWSLEGDLRYVPMAALYDRATKQYLLEKYQNVVFTRTGKDRLLHDHLSWSGGLAFGKANKPQIDCQLAQKPAHANDPAKSYQS